VATVERKRRSSSRAAVPNGAERDAAANAPAADAAKPKRQRKDERRLEKTNAPGVYKREKKTGGYSYVVIVRDQRGKQIKRYAETFREAKD
jgi:hypothetical protein